MPIQAAVVKTGSTGITITGGTDLTLGPDGQTVVNGIHVADVNQADFRIRRNLTAKNKVPAVLSDGSFSKDRKTVSFVAPKLLANGSVIYNLIRVEREVHPESTAAEALELNLIGAQLLNDSDFTAFWAAGSLS